MAAGPAPTPATRGRTRGGANSQTAAHALPSGGARARTAGRAAGSSDGGTARSSARDRSIRRALLRWFDERRRDLPWRRDRDPYRVWVSEVMLQQTRVDVVEPAFERFVGLFPDLRTLAAADEDAVLAAWSGLGYYRRARALHAAARRLVERGDTTFPRDPAAARELPGVGEYTTAAVLSIAWDVPLAAVDGNVVRVLSRLDRLGLPDGRGEPHREIAARLLDRSRPGDWNQALMELGQAVCRPVSPACAECPVGSACRARAEDAVDRHPPPKPRRATERRTLSLLVLHDRGGRVLLERGAFGHLRGMWLPILDVDDGAARPGAAGARGAGD
ncbi:MAG: A/G-specific adenine glycosylase, partial [Alphaproteobacteria bacterium]